MKFIGVTLHRAVGKEFVILPVSEIGEIRQDASQRTTIFMKDDPDSLYRVEESCRDIANMIFTTGDFQAVGQWGHFHNDGLKI